MKQENEDIARKMQYILNMRPVFNKEALFSDGTRYYRNPTEPKSGEKVIISFRTQKNNVDAVYLVSGDQKYKMKVYKTTKGFDYYGTKIVMPEEIFRYHFEIQYGWATCYYTITRNRESVLSCRNGHSLKSIRIIIHLIGQRVR